MKKAVAKTKKVLPASSKKNSILFLVSALAFSLFLLVVVLMAMGNSQDNRSDAAKKTPLTPKVNLFKNAGTGGKVQPAEVKQQPSTNTKDTTKKVAPKVETKPYVAPDKGSR
jgi:hypothetical protein